MANSLRDAVRCQTTNERCSRCWYRPIHIDLLIAGELGLGALMGALLKLEMQDRIRQLPNVLSERMYEIPDPPG
jgi:hypothetical protein